MIAGTFWKHLGSGLIGSSFERQRNEGDSRIKATIVDIWRARNGVIDRLNHACLIDSNLSLDVVQLRRHVPVMFDMPTQLIDYLCTLEAVDPSRNIARAYRIRCNRDLFGHTIVELSWGRIGRRAAGLVVSFANEEAARRFIQRTLAKLATAPRRLGVAYCRVNALALPVSILPAAANEGR